MCASFQFWSNLTEVISCFDGFRDCGFEVDQNIYGYENMGEFICKNTESKLVKYAVCTDNILKVRLVFFQIQEQSTDITVYKLPPSGAVPHEHDKGYYRNPHDLPYISRMHYDLSQSGQ